MTDRAAFRDLVASIGARARAQAERRAGPARESGGAVVLTAAIGAGLLAERGVETWPVIGHARWRRPDGHVQFEGDELRGTHLWLRSDVADVIDLAAARFWRTDEIVHWRGVPLPARDERLGIWRFAYLARTGAAASADIDALLDATRADPGVAVRSVLRPAPRPVGAPLGPLREAFAWPAAVAAGVFHA